MQATPTCLAVLVAAALSIGGAMPFALPDEGIQSWEPRASLPTARGGFGSAVLDGKVYAAGGLVGQSGDDLVTGAFEVYEPATDAWTALPPLPTPRWGLVLGAQADRLVAAGGSTLPGSFGSVTDIVEIYSPSTGGWTAGEPLPEPRIFAAGFGHFGVVHVMGGGVVGASPRGTHYTYSTQWTIEAPLLAPVENAAAVPLLNSIYLTGGWRNQPTNVALNGSTGQWETKAPMTQGRGAHAAAALNDRIYVVGGVTASTTECLPSTSVEAYDPTTNEWAPRPSYPEAFSGLGAANVSGVLYAFGGIRCDESSARMYALVSSTPGGDSPPSRFPIEWVAVAAAVGAASAGILALWRRRRGPSYPG